MKNTYEVVHFHKGHCFDQALQKMLSSDLFPCQFEVLEVIMDLGGGG